MPVYIPKDISSDLSPAWANTLLFDDVELSALTGSDSSRGASIPDAALRSFGFITLAAFPNNDAWEDGGTQTVELEIDAGSMDIRGRCRIVKLSSTGTIIESGSFTGFQTLVTDRIFSPVAPTWSGAEACGNRLAIEFEVENTNGMGMALTLTIGLGVLQAEVTTTITENSAGCAAANNPEPDLVGVIA